MKKYILIIVLPVLLIISKAAAQAPRAIAKNDISDSAFYNFQHGYYSRAIQLYKQEIAKTHYTYEMELLAMCYARMDSVEQEKNVLETAIRYTDRLGMTSSADCCQTLANIYFKEKNYKKALTLYSLYSVKFKNDSLNDINIYAFNFDNENSRSKCFEGLNMIDSAVNLLTPYIFCNYRRLQAISLIKAPTNPADSLRLDSICARYVMLLEQLHRKSSIKAELQKADKHFAYIETIEYLNNDFVYKEVSWSIVFYNVRVKVMVNGIGNVSKRLFDETQTPFYTREYQLHGFRQLPLCRMIRALPD